MKYLRFDRGAIVAALMVAMVLGAGAQQDISSQYLWQPVRIGVGGWVVGMVVHPLDRTVRYARTDVGNAYRWNNSTNEWIPMRVSNADGSGVQSATETGAPSSYGEDSVAVDPTNISIVYMVFPSEHSTGNQTPTNYVEIYKSVDGGKNFTPGNMAAAAIVGNPNGANRMNGEKLAVDPGNPAVLYYGSDSQGLWRSLDDGMTWILALVNIASSIAATCRTAMYPRLAPPQRGQQNPSGQRCRLNCSPHCCSSPNDDLNCCTVSICTPFLLDRFAIVQDYRYSFACSSLVFI